MRRELYEETLRCMSLPFNTQPYFEAIERKLGVPRQTLGSIYSQEMQRRVIKRHHILKQNLAQICNRYQRGADIIDLSYEFDFPPCIMLRRLLEGLQLGITKQHITKLLRNPDLVLYMLPNLPPPHEPPQHDPAQRKPGTSQAASVAGCAQPSDALTNALQALSIGGKVGATNGMKLDLAIQQPQASSSMQAVQHSAHAPKEGRRPPLQPTAKEGAGARPGKEHAACDRVTPSNVAANSVREGASAAAADHDDGRGLSTSAKAAAGQPIGAGSALEKASPPATEEAAAVHPPDTPGAGQFFTPSTADTALLTNRQADAQPAATAAERMKALQAMLSRLPEAQYKTVKLALRLHGDIQRCVEADHMYAPARDQARLEAGATFEEQLYAALNALNIAFWTEDALRAKGFFKTPDAKLQVPIAIQGRVVNWIDSKATFGDDVMHPQYYQEQYTKYINRYGPGAVIYWFDFLEDLAEQEGVVLLNKVPDASEIETLPMLPAELANIPTTAQSTSSSGLQQQRQQYQWPMQPQQQGEQ